MIKRALALRVKGMIAFFSKGYHVGTRELEEMGRFFCAGLLRVGRSFLYRNNQMSNDSASEMQTADSSW